MFVIVIGGIVLWYTIMYIFLGLMFLLAAIVPYKPKPYVKTRKDYLREISENTRRD